MKEIATPLELNRAVLAQKALLHAQGIIKLLPNLKGGDARSAMWGALCVFYARPFMRSNRTLGTISHKLVPRELRDVHEEIIEYRNTIAAHSDYNTEDPSEPVNGVTFMRSDEGISVEIINLEPSEELLDNTRILINSVLAMITKLILACLNEGPASKYPFKSGRYKLKVDSKDDWFEPVEKENKS
ncbi:hypothetical protein [Pelagicoccus sp. SDUM812003]|uniref:hypothetical protein n=1 Tax=Pelagicoccus sp. SDUM812003 TaxID=3041267 RepID=UPI00280DE00A|nr:hypothetical protein [Pelagicoccus sp. SDUM812003]MDQ8205766.1 hypothetical protein [Pelagicoccus sp. SDUM812003]